MNRSMTQNKHYWRWAGSTCKGHSWQRTAKTFPSCLQERKGSSRAEFARFWELHHWPNVLHELYQLVVLQSLQRKEELLDTDGWTMNILHRNFALMGRYRTLSRLARLSPADLEVIWIQKIYNKSGDSPRSFGNHHTSTLDTDMVL